MVKMFCFNNGITGVFVCLFLLYLDPNSTILCDAANELKSTPAPKICEVPTLSSPHMNNTYKCIKNIEDESKSCVSNGTVFELTVIKIKCNPGYFVNGKEELVSVCYDNEWVPPIKECSHPPVDCGRLRKNTRDSQTSSMPWDVTILRSDKETMRVCFGTIISSRVILTSEHCLLISVFDQYDYKSMSRRNPLDPAKFEVVLVNDLRYQINSTWWSRVKYYSSEILNPFQKHKHSTPLKIEEFRYFKHGNQDESLYHDPLIVIMEKEIKFDSQVYPACVQWENPKRLNITTGIAKVEQFSTAADNAGFSNNDYSFMSQDACRENPTYPYFVFNWAALLRRVDDEPNTDRNDTKLFIKRNPTALHNGTLFCLELKHNESIRFQTVGGSGVIIETDRRYFIRGIAGLGLFRHPLNDDARFKHFMNAIRNVANISYQDFSKNISDLITNGSFDPGFVHEAVFVFNYNFASLLRNHLKPAGELLTNQPDKLIGVTDIADYVDWIKHIVAEVDPYYIL
ncbi:uncharacterized protein LOC135839348 [Planococcus citri]|uniref:uncharacterized protein LOC135839348 n=1 Tax=Planococcus citri TaxID=170843 RepID=UPI0031F77501